MKDPRLTAFTLVELLVASVLAAVLMVAVLAVLGAVGRDRRTIDADAALPRHEALVELLRQDLANAGTMSPLPDGRGFVLVGHGGLDPAGAAPGGRLARVTYRINFPGRRAGDRQGERPGAMEAGEAPEHRGGILLRTQEYLDTANEPNRRGRWSEVAAVGATAATVTPASPDVEGAAPDARGGAALRVPARVRVRIEFQAGAVDEEWRVR